MNNNLRMLEKEISSMDTGRLSLRLEGTSFYNEIQNIIKKRQTCFTMRKRLERIAKN
jgi:hypothetical protein